MATNGSLITNNTAWMFGHIYAGQSGTNNHRQGPFVQLSVQSMPNGTSVAFVGLYMTIFLLGVAGNAIVCWVIGRKKEMSGSDVFMVSLAVTDLLSSALVPIKVIQDILGNWRWHLGSATCEILASIFPISLAASSWSLALIAADRFRIIVMPMKRHVSKKTKMCGVIFTGTIAIGVSLPLVMKQKHRSIGGEPFCLEYFSVVTLQRSKIPVILFAVIGWVIPACIVVILYGICIFKLTGISFINDNNDAMVRRLLENKRVSTTCIIVGTVFLTCTLPHAVSIGILAYIGSDYSSISTDFSTYNYFTFGLSNMNCCMNPFLYAIRQPEIKAFVKKKWNKLCCRSIQPESQHARRNEYPISAVSRPLAKGETAKESYTKRIT